MTRRRRAALAAVLLACASLGAPAARAEEAVSVFESPAHDGVPVGASTIAPPFGVRWTASPGDILGPPLAAGGHVYVAAAAPNDGPTSVTALDPATGHVLWSRAMPNGGMMAYDAGRLFVLGAGAITALAADTGAAQWTTTLTGQYSFTSPPVATGGQVFTGGAGSGGTLYALNETTGAIQWTQPVMNGDDSSPAVDGSTVYVSYVGPQVYAFDRATGAPRWHYSGCCEGGGGSTPTLHAGQLYSRADGDLVFDAVSGKVLSTFQSGPPPTFSGSLGVFAQGSTINGVAADGTTRWTLTLPPPDATSAAPVIGPPVAPGTHVLFGAGQSVYSVAGATGAVEWCGTLPAPPPGPSAPTALSAISVGEGLVLVPEGSTLTALAPTGGTAGTQGCAPVTTTTVGGGGSGSGTGAGTSPGSTSGASTTASPAPGATVTLKAGRARLVLGQATRVTGVVAGAPGGVADQTVRVQADVFPFDGRWRTVARAVTAKDGTFRFRARPPRNIRLRAQLVSAPEAISPPLTLYAELPVVVRRLQGRVVDVRAVMPPGLPARHRRVVFYLGRRGGQELLRVGIARWHRRGRLVLEARLAYPRRLGASDRVLVCTREPTDDGYGRPSPLDPLCGAKVLRPGA